MAVHKVTAVSLDHVVGAGQLAGVCILVLNKGVLWSDGYYAKTVL